MYDIQRTSIFDRWLDALTDDRAFAKITQRIERLAMGNPGDAKPVGNGVSEMRIDHGPGYRVYYMRAGKVVYVILCGGEKSTQSKDIERAREMAAHLETTKGRQR
jgi:putative addiction module killer protein